MGDDIGLGLSSMAICFDFHSTNVVQLSNRNPYFYRFWCHHPLITQLRQDNKLSKLTKPSLSSFIVDQVLIKFLFSLGN